MLIFLLLVAQFNSVRKTLIILFTIPLGLIGVTFGLIVADSIFGFMTILGIISLAGIIINNAIVLIDRINIERDENGALCGRGCNRSMSATFAPYHSHDLHDRWRHATALDFS